MSEQSLRDDVQKRSGHVDAGDAGYSKSLKSRHVNMIAIGGAIGTGLFLGAGGRLADAGPSLFIAYAVCGLFAFLVVRAPTLASSPPSWSSCTPTAARDAPPCCACR